MSARSIDLRIESNDFPCDGAQIRDFQCEAWSIDPPPYSHRPQTRQA